MRIRFLCDDAGAYGVYKRGEVEDIHDPDAEQLIKAGRAEPVSVAPPVRPKRSAPIRKGG